MQLIFSAIIIGALAALLGSLLGVGGGIIMVPAFKGFLGLSMKQAIATSLAVMIVTASVSLSSFSVKFYNSLCLLCNLHN